MDPLSIASGVAGLLQISIEIAKIIGGYVRDVHNAPKVAQDLATEFNTLVQVLMQLKNTLGHKAYKKQFSSSSVLIITISSCQTHLQPILSKLSKSLTKKSSLLSQLIWPFQKEEIEDTLKILHRYIQTFQFALTLDGWYSLSMFP
jgi:hypothetical protein